MITPTRCNAQLHGHYQASSFITSSEVTFFFLKRSWFDFVPQVHMMDACLVLGLTVLTVAAKTLSPKGGISSKITQGMSTFPQVIIHWSLFQWWRRKPMFCPCDAKVWFLFGGRLQRRSHFSILRKIAPLQCVCGIRNQPSLRLPTHTRPSSHFLGAHVCNDLRETCRKVKRVSVHMMRDRARARVFTS